MSDKRTYRVIDRDTAVSLGVKSTHAEFNRYALVAMRGNTLDTFVAWCYNLENAQKVADARNADMDMMRNTMEKTLIREDANDMPAGEPPADAPRKRGRPRKVAEDMAGVY